MRFIFGWFEVVDFRFEGRVLRVDLDNVEFFRVYCIVFILGLVVEGLGCLVNCFRVLVWFRGKDGEEVGGILMLFGFLVVYCKKEIF